MILDIKDVISTKDKVLKTSVEIDMNTYTSKSGSYSIIEKKPFELCLMNEDDKKLVIQAKTDMVINIPCDRCLTDVHMPFEISVDEEFSLNNGVIVAEDDEDGCPYINGSELDVDRLIYDEILVNWPAKVLCKKDCKGICPKCGQNLNQQDCGCDRTVLDPRMAKFQDIFKEFKEV